MKRTVRASEENEVERCGAIDAVHHFVDAPGAVIPIRWHYVEAGDPKNETIVFLHGNPESWHSWHSQIAALGDRYHIIAPDLKGYGQGDKRPGDWRWENCAKEMLAFLDAIGIARFNLVAHDRGAVLSDYLAGNNPERVLRYVRMQQILHIWRSENSPQAVFFADPIFGPAIFGDPDFYFEYRLLKMLKTPVAEERLERFKMEMSHPGMEHAVIRYFQSSSFEKERIDRVTRLIPRMNFPVLLLQADKDENQPYYYYGDASNPGVALFANARLEWVRNSGHYTNLEQAQQVTDQIERFIVSSTPVSSTG
jgi:pimeloyl-ACP methyl ester carboxylesterase